MNILELCRSAGHGGLEMYPHRVTRELLRRGHRVTVVTAPGTMLSGRIERDGIPQDHLPMKSGLIPFSAARRLAHIIDRDAIDIVHIHWRKDIDTAVWAKLMARRKVSLVHTRQMQITRPKRDPYHRFVYGRVDHWIAITDALAAQIRNWLPVAPKRITRLYYGVPEPVPAPASLRDEFIRTNRIPASGLRIGVFARIGRVKSQHLVVEAVAKLAERRVDAMAVLVGHAMDKPYLAETLARAAELGIADRIVHAGFLENATGFMNCFDVVVLPTDGETFGLALAEAMRAGVAVIGTNAGGVPEMIRDNETGLLFEPGDVVGLAAALERFAKDAVLRARLAAQGKAFADAAFDDAHHYDELMKIFGRTLAQLA